MKKFNGTILALLISMNCSGMENKNNQVKEKAVEDVIAQKSTTSQLIAADKHKYNEKMNQAAKNGQAVKTKKDEEVPVYVGNL